MILAIDPGSTRSGWVLYDPDNKTILDSGITDNEKFVRELGVFEVPQVAVIEKVEHYGTGMPVGADIFDTVEWSGQFKRKLLDQSDGNCKIVSMPRRTVKLHLCESVRAKDKNVRQAIIDRFPATGDPKGKRPRQIGTKKKPGPLYGIKTHEWSALALAVTFAESEG